MNRKIYLLSTALLILYCILSILSGGRSFLSPSALLQLGTILNVVFSIGIGLLLAYVLSIRFVSVWKGRIDITISASSRHAVFIQKFSRVLLYGYYILLPVLLGLLLVSKPIRAEIVFLFFPLLKILPVGYIAFEMARLIDLESKNEGVNLSEIENY